MSDLKIHFHAASTEAAQRAFKELKKKYGQVTAENADVIVPLGGDGTMLAAIHNYSHMGKPIYGMNRGSVGFLLNPYEINNLQDRIAKADSIENYPLKVTARTVDGKKIETLAFNDVALTRQKNQAVKINILINGENPMEDGHFLFGDGLIVCTAPGSTAYSRSAGGPVIPLKANVLGLTPNNPIKPAPKPVILPMESRLEFEILDPDHRPVKIEAYDTEITDVVHVEVCQSKTRHVTLLYDPDHNLEKRILRTQFSP